MPSTRGLSPLTFTQTLCTCWRDRMHTRPDSFPDFCGNSIKQNPLIREGFLIVSTRDLTPENYLHPDACKLRSCSDAPGTFFREALISSTRACSQFLFTPSPAR